MATPRRIWFSLNRRERVIFISVLAILVFTAKFHLNPDDHRTVI
jgi:hypothetical protein